MNNIIENITSIKSIQYLDESSLAVGRSRGRLFAFCCCLSLCGEVMCGKT